MKYSWIKITLLSLIVILLEAIGILIFFRPYLVRYRTFVDMEQGRWYDASQRYYGMSDAEKTRVEEYLPGYAAWVCERYIQGELSYDETATIFDAVNEMDKTKTLYDKYMRQIGGNELVRLINGMVEAKEVRDNPKYYELAVVMNNVMKRMNSDSRESIMIDYVNDRYQDFLDEELTERQLESYAAIIKEYSHYEAYDNAGTILQNISYVLEYRKSYAEIEGLLAEKKYMEIIRLCDEAGLDKADKLYRERFAEARADAYDEGKAYYESLLGSYADKGEADKAVELMKELDTIYGNDIDMSKVQALIAEDWQKSYLSLLEVWPSYLKTELKETEAGRYILNRGMSLFWPDTMCLYDIDKNGIPELIMFNSDRLLDEYIESFVFDFDGRRYRFLGYQNILSLCTDNNLITFPVAFGREKTGEECSLVEYSGDRLGLVKSCHSIDGKFYINGAEVTEADYLVTRADILSHDLSKGLSDIEYKSLDEAITLILTYK